MPSINLKEIKKYSNAFYKSKRNKEILNHKYLNKHLNTQILKYMYT